MPKVSNSDIRRSAGLWVQMYGDDAMAKAREMVEKMRRKGNEGGADVWLRIIVAISEFGVGAPPSSPKGHRCRSSRTHARASEQPIGHLPRRSPRR
jgi:hypothetical protein